MRRNNYFEISLILLIIGSFSGLIIFGISNESLERLVYGTGEIVFLSFEGGFFGINSDDGEHYDPINLPDEFKIDGLQINFIGIIRNDLLSFHMWGRILELIFIKEVET
jgi:inhibitor of cysteine peptidase